MPGSRKSGFRRRVREAREELIGIFRPNHILSPQSDLDPPQTTASQPFTSLQAPPSTIPNHPSNQNTSIPVPQASATQVPPSTAPTASSVPLRTPRPNEYTDIGGLPSSLIRLILTLVPSVPLKIFIASRGETPIRKAFESRPDFRGVFYLHEVEKNVVKGDIHKYLETSLANIKEDNGDHTSERWPLQSELFALLNRSGTLFIYAATAVRYIADGGGLYKTRLAEMASQGLEAVSEFETAIDGLYAHVLEKACEEKRTHEIGRMRALVSIVIFLRNPLPFQAIASISQIDVGQLSAYLSLLTSVIYVPIDEESMVAPFHASFPDFLTDSTRCSPERCTRFKALVAPDGHTTLALRCLQHMNSVLEFNICHVPVELTVSRWQITNSPENVGKVSEALKYSCLHWAFHLVEVQILNADLITALHAFFHEHLLHWIECISTLGELQTGLKLLSSAATTLSHFKTAGIQLLIEDVRRCVQMNFECIQKNCFEIYHSALVWIPKRSLIRKVYADDVRRVPKVILGLANLWGPTELVMQNGSAAFSIAFSPDGSQVVAGSQDKMVRIWNTTTGEIEAELKGHTNSVWSVAFSQDGCRVVSGSDDNTVRIWNVVTAEVEVELKGHTDSVRSVAFSPDSRQVVSGSHDNMVRIWNVAIGAVVAELKGHKESVKSVAFSPDGSRVVSGSRDTTVRIWNVATGNLEAELMGHMNVVRSVAFSQDVSQVISGSDDKTIRIWNATAGKLEAQLRGHTDSARCAAVSQDGSRVVSGSRNMVRIWNTATGEVVAELKGHTNLVWSVAFSRDGTRVVAGSQDKTVRIWNMTTGEVEAEQKGHKDLVRSVAFSQDGSRVVSGSRDTTVRIWNVTTGNLEAELKGHTNLVRSVAFSQDGSRVISGSDDNTARIWNVTTGGVEAELKGHKDLVTSVAFSQDSSQVVSGSHDKTVRIWNAATGQVEIELTGHTKWVRSVAFSQDGSRVVSGSHDKTVRIWNATTGESQLMTTVFITLPDSSEIQNAGSGNFHIIYPLQRQSAPIIHPPLHISDDGQWILGPLHDCWIPPQDRDFTRNSSSISDGRICLGYRSGRVVILDMTNMH